MDNIKTIRVVEKCFKTEILKTCKCPCCSASKSCPTLWEPIDCSTPGVPPSSVSWSLPKFLSIESMMLMLSRHPILCCPLLLPSTFPSIRVFSNESTLCISWPKYWNFSLSVSPSSEYSGLVSFRIDWLDLLAVRGTLKSLLQHHSAKTSIPQRSAIFMVQLSHPYTTTGKAIALTRWTFVGKVMSLLFNMLSRFSSGFNPSSTIYTVWSWASQRVYAGDAHRFSLIGLL